MPQHRRGGTIIEHTLTHPANVSYLTGLHNISLAFTVTLQMTSPGLGLFINFFQTLEHYLSQSARFKSILLLWITLFFSIGTINLLWTSEYFGIMGTNLTMWMNLEIHMGMVRIQGSSICTYTDKIHGNFFF